MDQGNQAGGSFGYSGCPHLSSWLAASCPRGMPGLHMCEAEQACPFPRSLSS